MFTAVSRSAHGTADIDGNAMNRLIRSCDGHYSSGEEGPGVRGFGCCRGPPGD